MERSDTTQGLGPVFDDLGARTVGFGDDLSDATRTMKAMDEQAMRLSRTLGSGLRTAFDRAVFGGGKLSDVLRGLASDAAGRGLNLALRPVSTALSGGIGSALGSLGGALGGVLGFAKGGSFAGGRALGAGVTAFANGGIVGGPTLFPMRGGTGLMGEAGPEAILPLSRGPDGRLGVAAGGGGAAPIVNIQITTPDVAGFHRSRGQIAAGLARAVQQGGRRL